MLRLYKRMNRNLGRATMNLEWKNRFLESRDTVMVQFRELAVMLEEFAGQMSRAADITDQKEDAVRRLFRLHQIAVDNMLLLEHEKCYREAYVTMHALGGRCMTAKDAATLFGQAVGGRGWYAPPDTRALITKQPGKQGQTVILRSVASCRVWIRWSGLWIK